MKKADDIDPSAFDNGISDDTFAKICALIRISVPYTGMIISTRESQAVREKVLPLGVSHPQRSPQQIQICKHTNIQPLFIIFISYNPRSEIKFLFLTNEFHVPE